MTYPDNEERMATQSLPTLGRLIQLLQSLGFVSRPAKPGVLLWAHAASGAEFLFRDRDAGTPARVSELANLRVQLTTRGLLTEKELDNLLAPSTHPTPQ
jgi:hypothetical protein